MLHHPNSHTGPEGFTLSFDKSQLQLNVIHGFLTESYWSKAIPKEIVARAIDHSLCVGVYATTGDQVAFARLITDYTTFGYLCDVFVLEAYRGRGLSTWMLRALLAQPELQRLRRWLLATADAHALYAQFGFVPLPKPDMFLTIHTPNVYQQQEK